MRYLIAVDDCFMDLPGGMGRVAWDMAKMMRDRGHRVAMFCARRHADVGKVLPTEAEGIAIFRYQRPALAAWHPWRAHRTVAAARAAAERMLIGDCWNLVHVHSVLTGLGVMQALGRCPRYVATVHSPIVAEQRINWSQSGWIGRAKLLVGGGILNRLERRLLARSNQIHVLSQYTRELLEAAHGVGARVTVVPHWRRPDCKRNLDKVAARRRLGWPLHETILLTVRGLGPRYGIDVAIEAIGPLAAAKRCLFIIAGDGPLRLQLEALARRVGDTDQIRFAGRLTDEQLGLAYSAADLFILPTRALECFGLITLEALSYGLPVLSTDCGAIPETMTSILPDFIVPAGDVTALRTKVDCFLRKSLRPPPGEVLSAYVSERFDRSVVLPKLVALLER